MRSILILGFMIFTAKAMAVCSSPISRTNYSANQVLTSARLNTDFNTVYSQINELPGDCITDESVTSAKIDDGTIVNADISASAAIARSKLGSANYAISTTSGLFTTTSTSAVDVTNLSAEITTTGNPVEISLIQDTSLDVLNGCSISASITGSNAGAFFHFVRNGTLVDLHFLSSKATGSTEIIIAIPGMALRVFDTPAAGTYTYKLQAQSGTSSVTTAVNSCRLLVREI